MATEDTEFREAVKRAIRGHDPDADQLRAVANDLDELADKWEKMDDTL